MPAADDNGRYSRGTCLRVIFTAFRGEFVQFCAEIRAWRTAENLEIGHFRPPAQFMQFCARWPGSCRCGPLAASRPRSEGCRTLVRGTGRSGPENRLNQDRVIRAQATAPPERRPVAKQRHDEICRGKPGFSGRRRGNPYSVVKQQSGNGLQTVSR